MLSGPATLALAATVSNLVRPVRPDTGDDKNSRFYGVVSGVVVTGVFEVLARTGWSVLAWVMSIPMILVVMFVVTLSITHSLH